MGLTEADMEDVAVLVWPENWTAVSLFSAMITQWRTGGMGGLVGLDYGVIPTVAMMAGVNPTPDEWPALFHDLRVMEAAALDALLSGDK